MHNTIKDRLGDFFRSKYVKDPLSIYIEPDMLNSHEYLKKSYYYAVIKDINSVNANELLSGKYLDSVITHESVLMSTFENRLIYELKRDNIRLSNDAVPQLLEQGSRDLKKILLKSIEKVIEHNSYSIDFLRHESYLKCSSKIIRELALKSVLSHICSDPNRLNELVSPVFSHSPYQDVRDTVAVVFAHLVQAGRLSISASFADWLLSHPHTTMRTIAG